MNQKCIAFIFARGGSKGLLNKNIKLLAGKPLIAHSIEVAKSCDFISDVIVSTDSAEIAAVAKEYGASVPFMRPHELATDTSPEWLSWQHAVKFYQDNISNFEYFLSVPATSPLRDKSDLENGYNLIREGKTDIVFSAYKSNNNPYFNMLEKTNGITSICKLSPSGERYTRRQDCPKVWNMTTVCYFTTPEYIINNTNSFDGKYDFIEVPEHRAVDIDNQLDFDFAEFLITRGKS